MKRILVLTVTLMVSACSMTFVQSEVARFNAIPSSAETKSVYIMPYESQEGNIEFKTYAAYLTGKLIMQGYNVVPTREAADFVAFLDYGVGGSRQVTGSTPIIGQTGGGTTYQSGTVNSSTTATVGSTYGTANTTSTYSGTSYTPATYGVVGVSNYSYTQHDRFLHFVMYEAELGTTGKPVQVYKGEVKSSGSSQTFARVSKCLMDALFDKFAETGSQSIAVDGKCMQ